MKVAVDGERVDLKDSRGQSVEPFIHDGTTYLPVRALGEILGKKVDWDGKTKTVHLGEGVIESIDEYTYLTEKLDPVTDLGRIYRLGQERKMEMGGKNYDTGVRSGSGKYIYFYLDGKYKEITGEIGTMSRGERENDVDILLDGELYKTIKIAGNKAPQKITIPVSGVNEINFEIKSERISHLELGLGNFKVK